jgi:heterodisulfide reductase subunit D
MVASKIILFLCNWAPHAAYQTLQDRAAPIPPEVNMVRIPCSGRISKALLFKPFEMGADGVALLGCESGTCRYGSGTITAQRNVADTRGILDLLGLGKDRLRLATFMPEESEALLRFLTDFAAEIKAIGKSPVRPSPEEPAILENRQHIRDIVAAHDVYACQDCGKCSCTTCGLCYDRCPSAVNFPAFIRDIRHVLKASGFQGLEVHGGFLQSLMRTMTSKDLEVKHWGWLPEDIQLDSESKTLFFGGCAPYFDTFFQRHLAVRTQDILMDGLRLLNFFDIYPSVLEDERCCGHDLLWSGDKTNYMRLAKLNVEAIQDLGINELITACPECYRTFAHDYPEQGVEAGFRVMHLFDVVEKEIDKGAVGFKKLNRTVTFQDPCRLSRFENRSDLPRRLMNRLNSRGFKEMQDRGPGAICCGNCAWTGCDSFSKAMQVKRIGQAKATGSDLVITACPKCQIHLRCAMEDPFLGEELRMDMMDLTSALAKTIQWE